MATAAKMSMTGDRAITTALKQVGEIIGGKAERRVIRNAIKGAGAVVLKRAKQLAPKKDGFLRRSLGVSRGRRIRKYSRRGGGLLMAILGPSWPLGAHGHLVEKGTKRRRTKAGANRGKMPAQPFLGPALAGKRSEVVRIMRERITTGIEREWKRWHKKRAG